MSGNVQEEMLIFPASYAERRLWLFDQLQPGHPAYNVPNLIRLNGRLDRDALERSLEEIIWRHEALRTTFALIDGELMQVIAEEAEHELVQVDLIPLPRHEREREAHRLALEEARRGFDLARGPLIRTILYRLREEEHWLMLNLHHIVTDGWSMGILFRELAVLYQSFSQGKGSPLPDLTLQYADYSHWQTEWLKGEVLQRQLAYWQQKLCAPLPVLELPADRRRPAVQTYAGRTDVFVLPHDLHQNLLQVSRREEATLFMTLTAAFTALLQIYSGQDDICVGTPIAGRTRTELKEIVGCFVNTLVLRTDLAGNPTLRERIARTKQAALEAYAHQDVPFEMLVEILQPERSPNRSPLFQVMLVLQNAPMDVLELPELTMSHMETDSAASHFDLSLSIKELAQGLYIKANYNTGLFDPATIERMMGHYQRLLEEIVLDADRPLSALQVLPDAERELVLAAWNETDRPYRQGVRVHELFEEQAARTPERVAVEFEGEILTYAELNERANGAARHLQRLGIGRGSRVGLQLQRSLELVIGQLAILKAGAAYVPLDPDYPPERLAYMQEDAELAAVLGASYFPDEREAENLGVAGEEEDPCYMLYTSGSTGAPKGVVIPHRALCNHMFWMQRAFPLTAEDAVLQKTSPSFDASVWEFYAPLLSGARLVLAPPDAHLQPDALVRTIRERKITVAQFVPSLLPLVLDRAKDGGCPGLRRVFCGGEVLTKDLQAVFHEVLSAELVNLYGPTEACIDAVYHVCVRDDERDAVPIGRPIDNMRAYVLDESRQPVPVGVPGELHLGGRGVASGYWKRPELTEEKFVPNPFGDGRLYRTGDLVRWLPTGELEYLRRADHQVKVRGFRVELGEAEAALLALEGVEEAVVLVQNGGLAAFVTGDRGAAAAWKRKLAERLPPYLVPSRFVLLDAMPLLPSGKRDRRALAALCSEEEETDVFTAPRTAAERKLTEIWADLLRRDRVSIHDSFFALGGHSLLAMQALMRVQEAFGTEMPLRTLFDKPTPAAFAEAIDEARGAAPSALQIPRLPRNGPLPLSFAQMRLLFFDRLQPKSPLYNIPYAVRITGRLQGEVLERSLQEILSRHEVLRTVFTFGEEGPASWVRELGGWTMPSIDLRTLPPEVREEEAMRLAESEAAAPFDLQRDWLLRAVRVRIADEESLLLLTMHHIISDGWSFEVLVRELAALYAAFAEGGPSPLPDLPIQYGDYAGWQRGRLSGEELERGLAYWKERLRGPLPLLELPTDHPRPAVPRYEGAVESILLPADLLAGLRDMSRQEQATLFMILLAAYQVLLHRYTGQDDVLVGTPVAGRTRPELEPLIGFFVNTLVLRAGFGGQPTFRELLSGLRETVLDAFAHQEVPFERLVEELRPERRIGRSPLIQTMFVLQNTPLQETVLDGLTLTPVRTLSRTAKFDLSLLLTESDEGLHAAIEYSTDLFEKITIERMLGGFSALLQGIVANPDSDVSRLPVLAERDRRLLLDTWSGTRDDYPRDRTLSELFEAQASLAPERRAVTYPDGVLSYRELNERANRLARILLAHGVTPGAAVAVCAEPSAAMIVAILAIVKTGAAYVPLDPKHPQERLSFMLADARVGLLLADEEQAGRHAGQNVPVLRLDSLPGAGEGAEANLSVAAQPLSPACVLYTSGSTGRPKGVLVPHRGIVRLVCSTNVFILEPGDRVAQSCNTSFDPFSLELWGALLNGGELVGLNRDLLLAPQRLKSFLREEKIAMLVLPTALFHHLVQHAPDAFATLRCLQIGGEALDPRRVCEVMAAGPPARLLNLYGPTENSTSSTFYAIEETPPIDRPLPIGLPVANSEVYVLDEFGQPMPIGAIGELHVGGDGLALGYLHRPELTGDKFVPHPFKPGETLYRTGDRARFRADGLLDYCGRLDQQVKLNGYRIEPGEIQGVLLRHEGVAQAFVTVREDDAGRRQLLAYVVPQGKAPASPDLHRFLRPQMPDYMLPTAYLVLDALPLTPNGKVDVRALPLPEARDDLAESGHVAPRDELERELAAIWADLLGSAEIGVTDSFFARGGHSLLAMQLLARIEAAYGRELPMSLFFQEPTVARLAARLRESSSEPQHRALVPLQPHGERNPLFLVHPVGGTVFCYRELALAVGPDQPLHALQADRSGSDSVEEMAAFYLDAVRTVRPHGPYRLGGWSLGGVVAYEMARQLRSAGEEVEELLLLDSFVPPSGPVPDEREIAWRFLHDLLGGADAGFDPQEAAGLSVPEMLERAREHGLLPEPCDDKTLLERYRVFAAVMRAYLRYELQPYEGKVTLFRAVRGEADSAAGWSDKVGSLDVRDVEEDHYSLLTGGMQPLVMHIMGRDKP